MGRNPGILAALAATVLLGIALFALSLSFGPCHHRRVVQIDASSRIGAPGPYRVASFTLFGSGTRYTRGILENAQTMRKNFPGWVMRVYVHQPSVPYRVLRELGGFPGVDIIPVKLPGNMSSKMWRFAPAMATPLQQTRQPDVVIVRDCDSRTSERDAGAVREWLRSDKPFHIIRDHPLHFECGRPVLAGLWGARGEFLQDRVIQQEFLHRVPGRDKSQDNGDYAVDEKFLMDWVYPRYRAKAFLSVSRRRFLWPGETLGQILPSSQTGEYLGQVVW